MKTVGIILKNYNKDGNSSILGVREYLIKYLRNFNVLVVCIPFAFSNRLELEINKPLIDKCDGIILPGGRGSHELDYKIVEYLYQINKPTLGLCLGMQLMEKTFNGHITKPIENHRTGKEYSHKITINKNTLLFKILKEEEIEVNSLHSFAIPNTSLDVSAISNDGVIEAIEDKTKTFFLGVQWHPEILDDIYSKRLFDYAKSSSSFPDNLELSCTAARCRIWIALSSSPTFQKCSAIFR